MLMQNSWILYRQQKCASDKNHDLLSFRREVVSVYFSKYASKSKKISKLPSIPEDVRFDMDGHFSEPSLATKRCALCKKTPGSGAWNAKKACTIIALTSFMELCSRKFRTSFFHSFFHKFSAAVALVIVLEYVFLR